MQVGMVGEVGLSGYCLLPGMGESWFPFPGRVTGIFPTFPTFATYPACEPWALRACRQAAASGPKKEPLITYEALVVYGLPRIVSPRGARHSEGALPRIGRIGRACPCRPRNLIT